MAIAIDWWPADGVDELQAFVDEHWRRGHVLAHDRELLLWQHARRDDPDHLAVLAAHDGDRTLGMCGFIEFDACAGGERVPGGWMTNWVVVPEARGRGLGYALVEHACGSPYEFVGALGANSATEHVLGRAGFAGRGMTRWIRILDRDALRDLLAGRDVPECWEESPASPAARPRELVGACRDDSFVRRRYREHPRFRYEVLEDETGFAAYRIERVQASDATVLRVVDFTGAGDLASRLAEAAQDAGVVFADFSCTSEAFGGPLEQAGFVRAEHLPFEVPGRFQPLDFSDRPIVSRFWAADRLGVDFASDALYVTRADSDLDRPV